MMLRSHSAGSLSGGARHEFVAPPRNPRPSDLVNAPNCRGRNRADHPFRDRYIETLDPEKTLVPSPHRQFFYISDPPDGQWYGASAQFELLHARYLHRISTVTALPQSERDRILAEYDAGTREAFNSDLPFAWGMELVARSVPEGGPLAHADVQEVVASLAALAERIPADRHAFELERVLLAVMGSLSEPASLSALDASLQDAGLFEKLDWARPTTLELGVRLSDAAGDLMRTTALHVALSEVSKREDTYRVATGRDTSLFVHSSGDLDEILPRTAGTKVGRAINVAHYLRGMELPAAVASALNGHVFEIVKQGEPVTRSELFMDLSADLDGSTSLCPGDDPMAVGVTTPFIAMPGAFAEQVSVFSEDSAIFYPRPLKADPNAPEVTQRTDTAPPLWTLFHELGHAVRQRYLPTVDASEEPATLLPLPPEVFAHALAESWNAADVLQAWLSLNPQIDPATNELSTDAVQWFANVTAEWFRRTQSTSVDDGFEWIEREMPDVGKFLRAIYGAPPWEWNYQDYWGTPVR
jgi:hypothetical protein